MAVLTAPTGSRSGSTAAVLAFVRFVVFGGGVTLLGSGALLLAGDRVPVIAANAVVTVATTVLATELHGRFTFRRGGASWSDHWASGLTVLMSYLFTTGALLAFDVLAPGGGVWVRQGVYLTASGLAGVGRFLLLRLVVFAADKKTPAVRTVKEPTAVGTDQAGPALRRPHGLRPEAVTAAA
ncbi:hypothetical protein OG552_25820 [Streptomyces sp. NBC_01476]|uniref:hypothetical protein n=1 Tax=Streptomyces sp. NBC_01476 TaxID=2903881 RepID=UPI002E33D689|nr:hypothetical protein [Streptomyces sp. NBC_01476]